MIHRILAGLTAISLILAFASSTDEDPKVTRARQDLKEARKILSEARDRLEETYLILEREFKRISGSYAAGFLRGLDKSWFEILPDIMTWWEEEEKNKKQVGRRRFADFSYSLLEKEGQKTLGLDSRLLHPFVSKGINFIYEKVKRDESIEPGDIESELMDILVPGLQFHTLWNEHLFMNVAEAQAFTKANENFAQSSNTLDRLEHPERYTAKGKLAPPRMVYIPGGNYTLGPNTGWEKSRRKMNFREFYIDKYEITNKEFRDFLASMGPELYNEYVPYFWPLNVNMEHYYPEDRADHPVVGVSWKAAYAYAAWCGKRLPTEEEWEIAARSKDGRVYPWGNRFDPTLANTRETGLNNTSEVGNFPDGVSPFGCMDMAGNVWEWTSTDQEGNRIKEPEEGVRNMVIRGGDYKEDAEHARCDFRWMTPMDPYAGRNPSKKRIGFRCVKNVE